MLNIVAPLHTLAYFTANLLRRHDTRHNDTLHNGTQHDGIQHNDTQHKMITRDTQQKLYSA